MRQFGVQTHVPKDVEEKRRKRLSQLEKQDAAMTVCEYHEGVRFLKARPGGCPKCEHLFKKGRAPDGKILAGSSALNPGGLPKGSQPFNRLLRRWALATDRQGRQFQEKIARRIVEGAAAGEEPFLSIYVKCIVERDAAKVNVQVEGSVSTQVLEAPEVPNEDNRDEMVAIIMADLAKGGDSSADILARLVPGTETEQ